MKILSALYITDYTLLLNFDEGGIIEVDLYDYLKKSRQPMTRQFLDVKLFRQFELVDPGHITWNWELDLDADWLYNYARQIKPA